ncbi:hypothetical protein IAI18_15485 [Acetobacteraceae bacterium H6797]|uniref:Uncharacterized protein n=1 Tax=Teichococcus rhizosphaerae TaxID=1335062 RepID=A0A2C7A680_9PROT|nr:hypothetical protein [Pseudoroseomonas rhizosphaerae]MBE9606267.1 hypothetical protein [Acetobacteraceae bacterium H6797]PHK93860.1 hypothetical protein CR162_16450 [Pseudoroseomonas rhizosphaerae]
MTSAKAPGAIPHAYTLKRHIARHAHRFWCPIDVAGALAAPIYVFPDQVRFDGDDVERLSVRNLAGQLKLPHDHVIFEVAEQLHRGGCLAAYTRATEAGVQSFLFRFDATRKAWTDVLVHTSFRPDGVAEATGHPEFREPDHHLPYFEAATSIVWRALGLLSADTPFGEHTVSRLRRTPLAKLGVRGWTYRVADIQPAMIAAALVRRGGTHASPRWHIRRGHWRQLGDGRRVFVRECQVGDASCGGVVKDYQVQFGEAA